MFFIEDDERNNTQPFLVVEDNVVKYNVIRVDGSYRIQNQRILLIYNCQIDKSLLKQFHVSLMGKKHDKLEFWESIYENNNTCVLVNFGYAFYTTVRTLFDYKDIVKNELISPDITLIKTHEWNTYVNHFRQNIMATGIQSQLIKSVSWFDQITEEVEKFTNPNDTRINWVYDPENKIIGNNFQKIYSTKIC